MENVFGRVLYEAKEVLLETLWPTRCAICDIPEEKVICSRCESKLETVDLCLACPRCGAPYGRTQCTECNETVLGAAGLESLPVEHMSHALVLDDAAKRIVSVYKDKDERRLCVNIAEYISRYMSPSLRRQGYICSFVPATKDAVRRRGFDHAQEIAEHVAKRCKLDCIILLERPKNVDQRKLGRRERIENMQGRMRVLPDADVPDKVVLIDDVCTTGATILSAAAALRDAGAQHVQAITFGQVLD